MKRILFLTSRFFVIIFVSCSSSKKATLSSSSISEKWINENLDSAGEQCKVLMQKVPEGVMPETFTDSKLVTCKPGNCIAGFYPGNLNLLFEAPGDSSRWLLLSVKSFPDLFPESFTVLIRLRFKVFTVL